MKSMSEFQVVDTETCARLPFRQFSEAQSRLSKKCAFY
uniref:Uncharacterized protein n=1 Tax=Anguilla anguilla TaxID=7936 RepID=A0A0E9TAN2_ANGAN